MRKSSKVLSKKRRIIVSQFIFFCVLQHWNIGYDLGKDSVWRKEFEQEEDLDDY